MTRSLFWKLCLIIATGVVVLFYFINLAVTYTEEDMSMLEQAHRDTIRQWGKTAEELYTRGEKQRLQQWMQALQEQENTWAAVASANVEHIAGSNLSDHYYDGYSLGRDVDWKVHLYFEDNPVMEVPFSNRQASFLIQLPDRMRPGYYWQHTFLALQVILPMLLLALVSLMLYRHIMSPLRQLELATRKFSQGNFDVRVRELLGNRDDELAELATTFDGMAARIGELIISQRQLIADLSHELRTPLARLDIAVESLHEERYQESNIERIQRESRHIRKLVDDSLTLAWLDNEQPKLQQETLDLVDLIDVIAEDARFEFPDRQLLCDTPNSATIENSNHRALGQALENILRNAMRYTPEGQEVTLSLGTEDRQYLISICDQGPGIEAKYLETIFKPFFRIDSARPASGESFGLGLALAQRQLSAVGGKVQANNRPEGGLEMRITLPKA